MRKVYTVNDHIDGILHLILRDRRLDPDARWALTQKFIEFIHLWEDTETLINTPSEKAQLDAEDI